MSEPRFEVGDRVVLQFEHELLPIRKGTVGIVETVFQSGEAYSVRFSDSIITFSSEYLGREREKDDKQIRTRVTLAQQDQWIHRNCRRTR